MISYMEGFLFGVALAFYVVSMILSLPQNTNARRRLARNLWLMTYHLWHALRWPR